MQRKASARWTGDLKTGRGEIRVESDAFSAPYSFMSRFEGDPPDGRETNPEELLGAAHAACYSMALSHALASAGKVPTRVDTTATVTLEKGDKGFAITSIALRTRGTVPGLTPSEFQRFAEDTKVGCIVSRALAAVPMTLDAALE